MADKKYEIKVTTDKKKGTASGTCPICAKVITINQWFGRARTGDPSEVALNATKGHMLAMHNVGWDQF